MSIGAARGRTAVLQHTFRALRRRDFRLFLFGQAVSVMGTWMQSVALGWLVYRLTSSPFLLGLTGFMGQIPSLIVAPLAGVWIDRRNRHRIVIATQLASALQALMLALLVLSGRATIERVLLLSLVLGLINAVDIPARQSFLIEMVEARDELANAIALNSATFNAARLLGPALAGVLIALLGEGPVFLLNALTYLPVLAALFAIRPQRTPIAATRPARASYFTQGVSYVRRSASIRTVLLFVSLVSIAVSPCTVLMPVFARDVLHGGPRTLGLLVASIGAGALCGSLFVATRERVAGLVRVVVACGLLLGLALAAFAVARDQALAGVALVLVGFGNTALLASSNTILQAVVEDDKRGRVMSFYTMALTGMAPLGSIVTGAMAGRVGPTPTVLACGVACLIGALLFRRAARGELRLEASPD